MTGFCFLNVFFSTILNPNFRSFINKIVTTYPISQNIIFEINEMEDYGDTKVFMQALNFVRELGIGIAIDDMGKGNSQLQSIIEWKPDYVKLDRYLTKGLNESKRKQSIVKLLLGYSQEFGIKVIMEGIETVEELKTAKDLGVYIAQGFALGTPERLKTLLR
ncbi:EAL domain-containing protein [Halobacillus rhizosphaerae]|uniref:EAL domain-containing protein n=1 Tax=Halobacillus rhizosphaerae TaxID=3064889 RepID=UPI00398A83A7